MNDLVARTFAWMLAELILTGVLFLLYSALRRLMPVAADRYLFLKLTLAVVIFQPWIPFSWAALLPSKVPTASSVMAAAPVTQILPASAPGLSFYDWLPTALVGAYIIALGFFIARILMSLWRLHRLAAKSKALFVYNGIEVRSLDDDIPPTTFGLIRPLILISNRVLDEVSPTELQMILQHEQHHIKRHDYLFNLAKAVVQAVLVFSPFAHKLAKAFVEEMELSCDALVVSLDGHKAKDYGALLLRLATQTTPRNDLVCSGVFVSNSFISRRITAMKDVNLKAKRAISLLAFGAFAMIVGPAVTSLGLEAAVEEAKAPQTCEVITFAYEAMFIPRNDRAASASGTVTICAGNKTNIQFGPLQMEISPRKVAAGWARWYFEAEVRYTETGKVLTRPHILTEGEAKIIISGNESNGDDFKSFSLSLTPL